MPNGKTSYSMKWEEQFGWLRKAKKPDGTIPSVYNKTCRSDGGGLTEVKSHQKSKSHREKESTEPNQRAFVIGAKESINLSSSKVSLTTKKFTQRAGLVQALKFVDSNHLPDSELRFMILVLLKITMKEQQKSIYNIQFGIA